MIVPPRVHTKGGIEVSRVYARYVLFVWYNVPESCLCERKEGMSFFSFFFAVLILEIIAEFFFCTYPGTLCGCILQLDHEFLFVCIFNSFSSDLPSCKCFVVGSFTGVQPIIQTDLTPEGASDEWAQRTPPIERNVYRGWLGLVSLYNVVVVVDLYMRFKSQLPIFPTRAMISRSPCG